jgi:DNA-binding transcriptional LysR family regulator
VAAVDTGSLSAASRDLRIPLATVSRRVAELEEHLNVQLLHRGSHKVVLTDAGRSYVTSCRRIIKEITEVERAASDEYRAPQPARGVGPHVLPIVVDSQRTFPDIRMRMQLTDRFVSLLEEHIDVAVCVSANCPTAA